MTFDIEHLRYRQTISNVKNVAIERAFDIEVFDIERYARNRTSDTRYRGAKVPDEQAFSTVRVFDPQQPLERDASEPHI